MYPALTESKYARRRAEVKVDWNLSKDTGRSACPVRGAHVKRDQGIEKVGQGSKGEITEPSGHLGRSQAPLTISQTSISSAALRQGVRQDCEISRFFVTRSSQKSS